MADRVFTDPEGFGPDSFDLLDDPFELAACALWLCSWNTPEDASILLGNRPKAWALWAEPLPHERHATQQPHGAGEQTAAEWKAKDRHLFRRRAALALDGAL